MPSALPPPLLLLLRRPAAAAAPRTRRRGGVSVTVLLALPLMFLAMGLALFAAEAVRARAAQTSNADASALGIAGAIIDDALLLEEPNLLNRVLASAKEKGCELARENLILGRDGVELRVGRKKEGEGKQEDREKEEEQDDIVLGVRNLADGSVTPLDLRGNRVLDLCRVDTVQVTAHRTRARGNPLRLLRGPLLDRLPLDLTVRARVAIDRDIIGLKPLPDVPVPLAPIALLSDPKGKNELSWEYQVEKRNGSDDYAIDRSEPRPRVRDGQPDGLHEMEVRIGDPENNNACLLQLGVESLDELGPLLLDGARTRHFEVLGGEMVLDEQTGETPVPGTKAIGANLSSLARALLLMQQRGEALVWPLFQRTDERSGMPLVSGFVAARILAVGKDDGVLVVLIQPAQKTVPAAVTASSRSRSALKNRYLARLRLAD